MTVRGVEIEVARAAPDSVGARMAAREEAGDTAPTEHSVRSACAAALADARARGAESVALPAFGVAGGMPAVTSGKIVVQEAIRVARAGTAPLRRIVLCCTDAAAFDAFQRTVNGYLRHLLDVLIWGPFVTVDAIIELPAGIVLVKRSNPPLGYALPGGFVDYGESLESAVRRESMEETGLELLDLAQFHTYSDPSRDPRFHTITTVFTARAVGTPRAGDDAADVRVAGPAEIPTLEFAFDHAAVLRDYLAARGSGGAGRERGATGAAPRAQIR
jgi:ADP-ribose pyrophosphatase YjhB (NUDIX family)